MESALTQLIYAMPVIKTFHLRHTNGFSLLCSMVAVSGKAGGAGHGIAWQQFGASEASATGLGVFSTPPFISRVESELCHIIYDHCERGPAYSMLERVHILWTWGGETRW